LQRSTTNVASWRSRWLNAFNPQAGTEFNTLQNYYKECSWGRVRFETGNNIVVDLTNVDLGCSGTWQGQAWSASQCGFPELYGWMDAAQQYTLKVWLA
jgi:hypothetical protein